jgi:nucleotide-binding universal stress UspA family protein
MFGKILVAVDGSESSERAASVAAELAAKHSDRALVLHVREWRMAGAGGWPAGSIGAVELEEPNEAAELVRLILKRFESEGATATAEVRPGTHGSVAAQILDIAKKEGVGLIVMGSRGLSDLSGLLLGSVTHRVLHLAECPVLVIR